MILDYYFADPTGNMTLLVTTAVPEALQPEAAEKLMLAQPRAEQTGFITPGTDGTDICLRMAGGEFCGNATMSAAALLCHEGSMPGGSVSVRASGEAEPVHASVRQIGERSFSCTVTMPGPVSMGYTELEGQRLYAVSYAGIVHLISEKSYDKACAEVLVKKCCAAFGAKALGLMQLDIARAALTPLVYVPGAGTLFWETSCASGTAAAGEYLSAVYGTEAFAFTEPGGVLKTRRVSGRMTLEGTVSFSEKLRAEINE